MVHSHAGLIWPDGPVNIKKLSWYLGLWCVWGMYHSPASTFFLQLATVHMFNDDIYVSSPFRLFSSVSDGKKFRKPFWLMSSSHSSRGDPCIVIKRNELFGTDPDRNGALEETPRNWTDSCRWLNHLGVRAPYETRRKRWLPLSLAEELSFRWCRLSCM